MFDITVRTDSLLARLWKLLDQTVGLENCTIALTADHGVAPIPEYIVAHVPGSGARHVNPADLLKRLGERLASLPPPANGGEAWIERVDGDNIYLNPHAVDASGLDLDAAARILATELATFDEVAAVFTSADLLTTPPSTPLQRRVRNSFLPSRSGNLVVVLKPFLLAGTRSAGTSHGSPYPYDSHVPLMLAGSMVRPGTYDTQASPADIAPTLSVLLGIELPSQYTGRALLEAILRGAETGK